MTAALKVAQEESHDTGNGRLTFALNGHCPTLQRATCTSMASARDVRRHQILPGALERIVRRCNPGSGNLMYSVCHARAYLLSLTLSALRRSLMRALTILVMSPCGMGPDSGNCRFPFGPMYLLTSGFNDLSCTGG